VLESVGRRFGRRAREAGRRVEIGDTALVVHADPLRLDQAIGSVVDNALRYGIGTVTVAAVERGEWVEVHVSDQGRGFSPEFLPRAFERFSRGQAGRDGGSGLGLAIVRTVARAHGGEAHAANAEAGADVWISLPRS